MKTLETPRARLLLAWVFTSGLWLIVLTRSVPGRVGDRGIFISVAERLRAGDVLYTTVWDNKDPLFFLLLAAGRTLSPQMDFLIEFVWLLAASVAGFSIARSLGLGTPASIVVGAGGVPIVLVGGEYIAGFTHLPASSLTIVLVALTMRKRFVLVGLLLVVLALFKIIMLPLALAAVIPMAWHDDKRTVYARMSAGALIGIVAASALLVFRGELLGYLHQFVANITYAGGNYMDESTNAYLNHLEYTLTSSATVTALSIIAVLSISYLIKGEGMREPFPSALFLAVLLSFIAAVVIIAFTGLRYHHAQVLYAPAALALLLLVGSLRFMPTERLSSFIGVICASFILAGGIAPQTLVIGAQGSFTQLRDLARLSEATAELVKIEQPASYARLGDNMDDAHAIGLDSWRLACPRFAQYGTDSRELLQETTDCLVNADYLLVENSFALRAYWPQGYFGIASFDIWNNWIKSTEETINRHFQCESRQWGRICTRNSS